MQCLRFALLGLVALATIVAAGLLVAPRSGAQAPLGGDFTDRVVVQARLVEPSAAAFSP